LNASWTFCISFGAFYTKLHLFRLLACVKLGSCHHFQLFRFLIETTDQLLNVGTCFIKSLHTWYLGNILKIVELFGFVFIFFPVVSIKNVSWVYLLFGSAKNSQNSINIVNTKTAVSIMLLLRRYTTYETRFIGKFIGQYNHFLSFGQGVKRKNFVLTFLIISNFSAILA